MDDESPRIPSAMKNRQNRSNAVMATRIEGKESLDDFPTPPWATRALIEHVRRPVVWARARHGLLHSGYWAPWLKAAGEALTIMGIVKPSKDEAL